MAKNKTTLEEVKSLGLENLTALLESSLGEDDEDKDADVTPATETSIVESTNIAELFEGIDGLPAGFADKAKTLFEAAVIEKSQALAKDNLTALEESIATAKEAKLQEDADQLDAYLAYVTEAWMEENKPVVESKMKVELAESFVSGITKLLAEYNVTITPEQESVVESLETKLSEAETQIEELVLALAESKKATSKLQAENIIKEATESMTDVEAERFTAVLGEMEFVTTEDFANKVDVLKSVFTNKEVRTVVTEAKDTTDATVITESTIDVPSGDGVEVKELSATMQSYVTTMRANKR